MGAQIWVGRKKATINAKKQKAKIKFYLLSSYELLD